MKSSASPQALASVPDVSPDLPRPTFRTVYDENFDYAVRSLRRLGIHPGDLEDTAQELFLSLHQALPSYDPTRPLRPWLFAFAHRFAANYHRLARHRVVHKDMAEVASGGHETELDRHARREVVLRALLRVNEERRAVLILHDLDGFAGHEIAEALKIPESTVHSRLRLARQDMRAALAALGMKEVGL